MTLKGIKKEQQLDLGQKAGVTLTKYVALARELDRFHSGFTVSLRQQ